MQNTIKFSQTVLQETHMVWIYSHILFGSQNDEDGKCVLAADTPVPTLTFILHPGKAADHARMPFDTAVPLHLTELLRRARREICPTVSAVQPA